MENVEERDSAKISARFMRRNQQVINRYKNSNLSLKEFLVLYKINTEKLVSLIYKYNKLYNQCKSKRIDKIIKYRVISHILNRRIKNISRKKNVNFVYKWRKRNRIQEKKKKILAPTENDQVRKEIKEQLELLRIGKNNVTAKTSKYLDTLLNVNKNEPKEKTNIPIVNIIDTDKKTKEIDTKKTIVDGEKSEPSKQIVVTPVLRTSNAPKNISSKLLMSFQNKTCASEETNESDHFIQPTIPVVVEVIGGFHEHFNIDTENSQIEKDDNDKITESEISSGIFPTKTNDITKIKGWRSKLFKNKEASEKMTQSTDKSTLSDLNIHFLENLNKSSKSAFESDVLENFLINSKLNISYEVPKLIAEDTISDPKESSLYCSKQPNYPNEKKPDKNKLLIKTDLEKKFKAKTLAEKRRMLEMNNQKQILHDIELNEVVLMKQLQRENKKNKIESITEIRQTLREQNIPITRDLWLAAVRPGRTNTLSQVARISNKQINIIGSTDNINLNLKEINTRFLSNKKTKIQETSNYKPGPLSKKPRLQQSVTCETVLKPMPTPVLQVFPEIGKQMPNFVKRFLKLTNNNLGLISKQWAEYAVSVLTTKSEKYEKSNVPYVFKLPYANEQNRVLMRSLIPKNIYPINSANESIDDIESEVNNIMSDMLTYLDTPVIDNSVIPFCPDAPLFSTVKKQKRKLSMPDDDLHTIIKSSKRSQSKVECELKRLSVKVIEVNIDNKKPKICTESSCQMGCVCLDAMAEWPKHCGRESCIFECQCRFKTSEKRNDHHYVNLPQGSNLLSESTVGRLQDRVKRNLAKEERKFTQTVIKANDQTIVVGENIRERRKRATKVPQKYSDFINIVDDTKTVSLDNDNENNIEEIAPSRKSIRIWNKSLKKEQKEIKKEVTDLNTVLIQKLDGLENVMVWCMVHNLYKCFCGGLALKDSLTVPSPKPVSEIESSDNDSSYIEYSSKRISQAPSGRTISDITCARSRGVPDFLIIRNKSDHYKQRNVKIKKEESKSKKKGGKNNDNDFEVQIVEIAETNIPETKKKTYTPEVQISSQLEMSTKTENEQLPSTENITNPTASPIGVTFGDCIREDHMLPDLLIPQPLMQKHLRHDIFRFSTGRHVFRLMSWDNMIKHFEQQDFYFWYNEAATYAKIIATKHANDCPSNFTSIHNTSLRNKQLPEIVKSLLIKKLPGKAVNANETFAIFVYNGAHWEIRGTILTKNTDIMPIPDLASVNKNVSNKTPKSSVSILNTNKNKVSNDSIQNEKSLLDASKNNVKVQEGSTDFSNLEVLKNTINKGLTLQEQLSGLNTTVTLMTENVNDSKKSPLSLKVPIPVGDIYSRWYMLILENDFFMLSIIGSSYKIKYSQLKEATRMANKHGKTIRLAITRDVHNQPENNPTFGVYAVPDVIQRVFFGPYNMDEDHGIVTYKYLNGNLVPTVYIDKFYHSDQKKVCQGVWLYTHGKPKTIQNSKINNSDDIPCIDLTEDDVEIVNTECEIGNVNTAVNKKENIDIEEMPKLTEENAAEFPPKLCIEEDRTMPILEPIVENKNTLDENVPIDIVEERRIIPEHIKLLNKTKSKSKRSKNTADDDLEKISLDFKNAPRDLDMWLISEPPNFGYLPLRSHSNGTFSLVSPFDKKTYTFKNMEETINWIDRLLRRKVLFLPSNFQIRMCLVRDKEYLKDKIPLGEDQLRGYHMVCKNGLFNLTTMTLPEIDLLNLTIQERNLLLMKIQKAIIRRLIYTLGRTFLTPQQIVTYSNDHILKMAPEEIKKVESENIHLKTLKKKLQIKYDYLIKKSLDLLMVMKQNKTKDDSNEQIKKDLQIEDDDVILIEDNNDEKEKEDKKIAPIPTETKKPTEIIIKPTESLISIDKKAPIKNTPRIVICNKKDLKTETAPVKANTVGTLSVKPISLLQKPVLKPNEEQVKPETPTPPNKKICTIGKIVPINKNFKIVNGKILYPADSVPPAALQQNLKKPQYKASFVKLTLPNGQPVLIPVEPKNKLEKNPNVTIPTKPVAKPQSLLIKKT